jgi:hypothetical protein
MTNAFNKLSYDDKVCIKQLDIKFIKLNSFINTHKNSSNRKFNSSCHWLTGSETKSNFFCWPCLLFNNPKLKSPWCTTGVDNLKTLHQSVEKHGKSKDHTYLRSLTIKIIWKAKHRKFFGKVIGKLKRLIDMTIFLGTQELSFPRSQ